MKTIEFKDGMKIQIRKFTEDEFCEMQDKKTALMTPGVFVKDPLDDGDEEVMNCITHPDRETVEKYFKRYARASNHIRRELMILAGESVDCYVEKSIEEDEILKSKHGEDIIGVSVDGTILGMRRLTRLESKVLDRELGEKKFFSHHSFAKLGRSHVLPEYQEKANELFNNYPILYVNLGAFLLRESNGEVAQFEKK